MKSIFLALLIFVSVNSFSQSEFDKDTVVYKDGKMTVKSLKKSGYFQCRIFDKSNQLVRSYECISPLKTIDLMKWDSLMKAGDITKNGPEFTYRNGKISRVSIYDGGDRTNFYTEYYETGLKKSECLPFQNGLYIIKSYYEDGNIRETDSCFSEKEYRKVCLDKKGELKLSATLYNYKFHGELLLYRNGQLIRKEMFSNGKPQDSTCYNEAGEQILCSDLFEPAVERKFKHVESFNKLTDSPAFKNSNDTILFSMIIGENGETDSLDLSKVLNKELKESVEKWAASKPYAPAKLSGQPVKSRINFYILPACEDFYYEITSPDYFSPTYTVSNSEVKTMPEFPGGYKKLLNYLDNNISYPVSAYRNGVAGRVVLQFIVSSDGSIKNVRVLRSLSTECNKEAIRVVKEMPKWIPGKYLGQPVDVVYTLPVLFTLKK